MILVFVVLFVRCEVYRCCVLFLIGVNMSFWFGLVFGCNEWFVKWLLVVKLYGDGMLLGIWYKCFVCILVESIEFNKFWVYLWVGCVNKDDVGVVFMIWFVYIMVMECVSCVIKVKLWFMNIIVKLSFLCNLLSNFIIFVWIVMFNVVVGLFVIKSFGLWVNVIVIIICWCCLLDNLCG